MALCPGMLLWLVLIVFGVWPWVRPKRGVCVATAWHVACGQRACEGAGMRDNRAADRNNESWTKLEKKYKEYRNLVLILTHGLQTRLCCRFVENHVLKEWHWLGSWGSSGRLDSSVCSKCPEVQGNAGSSSPGDDLGSPRLLPSPRHCCWRGHGQRGALAQRACRGQAALMTWLLYASSSPVDTINRMATGRWSVRPDSWVIKLNSSTSAFQSGHSPSSAYSM